MGATGYNRQGLYIGYDKNNKERQKEDYYATPPQEVTNILNAMDLNLTGATILEPCVGAGHMLEGIVNYTDSKNMNVKSIICSDIKDRGCAIERPDVQYAGFDLDFFADDYPINSVDYVIMNPPYKIIEPFVIRALEIAQKGVLMLARLQFLEGKGRYDNIFSQTVEPNIWVYVNRINCWKNGIAPKTIGAQAYAWFYFDLDGSKEDVYNQINWLMRAE